jgi:cobalt-zinc-cadmium efflux system outer membrane protein
MRHALVRLLDASVVALLTISCTTPPDGLRSAREAWSHATPPADLRQLPDLTDASLDDLIIEACQRNPGLEAAAATWEAALERVEVSGSLPDPRLTGGYFLEEVQTRTGPMQWRLGISQPLPAWGALDSAERKALAMAQASGARYESARLRLVEDIRKTWAELAWIDEAVRVTAPHRDLLQSWELVARTRYSTGLGGEPDVIRAQVELGKLGDRVRSLEDLRRPMLARVNAALDRPTSADLPRASFEDADNLPFRDEELRALLSTSSPELRALRHEIQAAEAHLELARANAWPETSLGLDWTRIGKGGDDALAVTAGISLPIRRSRIRAGISASEAQLSAAQAQHRMAANELASDVELELYRLRDSERRLSLFRDSLEPKGEESVQVTHVAYQSGDSTFLDLVDAERVLLEFQLATARARADRAQALATLEALSGIPLSKESTP